jgi:CheY-like chemotaxis protein
MPKMNGIALVRNLANTDCSVPTIIFVSGDSENPDELRKLGVRAFLSKPVRRTDLVTASQNTLGDCTPAQINAPQREQTPGP